MTDDREPATDPSSEGARPADTMRDADALRADLTRWLTGRLGDAAAPEVTDLSMPSANGMSSDTVLFDAAWTEDGRRVEHRLVARVAPDAGAVPVFPAYDLEQQFEIMRRVAEHSDVPVPRVLWLENDPTPIGAPFFVMARVDGDVPPDVMPYNFGSWLTEASLHDQMRLQHTTISALVRLHAIADPERVFDLVADADADATADAASPLRRHVESQRRYYHWVTDGGDRSPLIEQAFDWLEERWPVDEGPAVLSWGDARIGNVMYRDFEPVAVLDWEMAALAPREIDIGWMIFLHRFFEDIATVMELPGMPHFLRRDEVASTYHELSGHEPRDLEWYTLYAALRHGIVMSRVKRRAIAFGESEMPDDVDDLIMHRAALEAMLDGTYWSSVEG